MAATIDLQVLLETPIQDPLPEATVKQILSSHPFIPIPYVLNLRTISNPPHLQPNLIFRSGALSHLPASALAPLRDTYNIKTIFDLRSAGERQTSPSPDIAGIKTIWIPSGVDAHVSTNEIGERKWKVGSFNIPREAFVGNQGREGYVKMYQAGLETHRDAYKAVFESLRDGDGGLLFHCTAGKDRTGVLAALILSLVNAPEDTISQDYALTRIGTEPFRDVLLAKLLQQLGDDGKELGLDSPGMENLCSTKGPNIVAFLKSMDEKWGGDGNGVKGYLTQELGLTEQDLEKIRERLGATQT